MKNLIFLIFLIFSFSVCAEYSEKVEFEKIKKEVMSCHKKAGSNDAHIALKKFYNFDTSILLRNNYLEDQEKFYLGENLNIKDLEYLKNYFSKYENDICFKHLIDMVFMKFDLEESIADIRGDFYGGIYENRKDFVEVLNYVTNISFFIAYDVYTERMHDKQKKSKAMDSL